MNEFEQVETMLSTIGDLLTDEAKIILTSRKTAIFAGAEFGDWVDSYNGNFDVIRFQLEKPNIKQWLSTERYEEIIGKNVPLDNISNPVLLTYLRNISKEDFSDLLVYPETITDKYFDTDQDFDITSIYKEVCELEKSRIPEFEKEIIRSYNSSKKCFDEAPEDDRDSLQLFAFICNLSFDIYVKKQIVEKLLDNFPDLLHSENTGVKKDSAKKEIRPHVLFLFASAFLPMHLHCFFALLFCFFVFDFPKSNSLEYHVISVITVIQRTVHTTDRCC